MRVYADKSRNAHFEKLDVERRMAAHASARTTYAPAVRAALAAAAASAPAAAAAPAPPPRRSSQPLSEQHSRLREKLTAVQPVASEGDGGGGGGGSGGGGAAVAPQGCSVADVYRLTRAAAATGADGVFEVLHPLLSRGPAQEAFTFARCFRIFRDSHAAGRYAASPAQHLAAHTPDILADARDARVDEAVSISAAAHDASAEGAAAPSADAADIRDAAVRAALAARRVRPRGAVPPSPAATPLPPAVRVAVQGLPHNVFRKSGRPSSSAHIASTYSDEVRARAPRGARCGAAAAAAHVAGDGGGGGGGGVAAAAGAALGAARSDDGAVDAKVGAASPFTDAHWDEARRLAALVGTERLAPTHGDRLLWRAPRVATAAERVERRDVKQQLALYDVVTAASQRAGVHFVDDTPPEPRARKRRRGAVDA
jgi:hypothetical protein